MTIFLCGDVMTGRGIDQIFPYPSDPRLDESYGDPPLEYVALAEKVHGHIPRPVHFSYIWGDALEELERFTPDIRIVNLETSVTTSEAYELKGIHYRMHPANVPCLTAAGIDCCVLANNHTLDWGPEGLVETMAVLQGAGLKTVGAGRTAIEAVQPASFLADNARLLVFAAATTDCGVLAHWAAGEGKPGIALLTEISEAAADSIAARVQASRRLCGLFHPLGRELGIRNPAGATGVCSSLNRCRRSGCHSRTFFPPPKGR